MAAEIPLRAAAGRIQQEAGGRHLRSGADGSGQSWGKKKEAAEILDRIVALEPTQANLQRVAELASELGNRKVAASAFQKIAQLVASEGGDAAQWYERAYQEDASDQSIALAYGKSLLAQGQVGAAIFILEPQMNSGEVTPALRETYADALVAAGRHAEAEPLVWQLFEQNPARVQQVIALIGNLLDGGHEEAAVALARKLEQFQRRRGERRQFIAIMEDITATRKSSSQMLEFLSELYNASNRENDYCQTLLKLFDLYCSTGEYAKAAECLDRAAEVDPYESGPHEAAGDAEGQGGRRALPGDCGAVHVRPARRRKSRRTRKGRRWERRRCRI